ncbi:hypothetical protein GCM10008915_39260 [Bifidobacterium pullorum subsp. gallinarum]
MRIGLARHFRVNHYPQQTWMTSSQFNAWVEEYNQADIEPIDDNHYMEWDICFSSDLSRAVQTAEMMHQGPVITTPQLREIEVQSISHFKKFRMHYQL